MAKRKSVEPEKLQQTEYEIRGLFVGYTSWQVKGWYCDPLTGEEFRDRLLRYEMDGVIDAPTQSFELVARSSGGTFSAARHLL